MDSLTQQRIFLMVKINSFWGYLSGISAKTATLPTTLSYTGVDLNTLTSMPAYDWEHLMSVTKLMVRGQCVLPPWFHP